MSKDIKPVESQLVQVKQEQLNDLIQQLQTFKVEIAEYKAMESEIVSAVDKVVSFLLDENGKFKVTKIIKVATMGNSERENLINDLGLQKLIQLIKNRKNANNGN